VLEYAPPSSEPEPEPEPEQEPEPEPEPPPSLQIAVGSQQSVSDIEVWIYTEEERSGKIDFIDEMSFESAGEQIRLVRLDPKTSNEGSLELPREVEGSQILLYHPDYWPQKMDWQQIAQPIQLINIKQERSLKDFDKARIDGAEYFYGLAEKYHSDGDLSRALKNYENALRLSPRLKYYLGLGWTYYEDGQTGKALKQASTGLELKLLDDPDADEELLRVQLQELVDLTK
jgi:tetratricopeptide (TPR) repeat protein